MPDLIDKPIGWMILRDRFDANGHLWGHTLLAAFVVLLPGVWLVVRHRDPRVAVIGLAMLSHLAVDPVNHSPQTLLWPMLGTDFPKIALLGIKMTILTESISFCMLAGVVLYLVRTYRFPAFILEGRIEPGR